MQIAFKLDQITKEKIVKSLLLGTAGFVLAVVPVLLSDQTVSAFLKAHPVLALAVGSYVPVVLNAVRQWMKGQSQA